MNAILVVGAGFAGATYARELAEHGWQVEVIDQRPHIAGNAYDEIDATGVRRHAYGPHLFHTSSDRVMNWLRRFGAFVPYEHRVSAFVPRLRRCVPLPVNRTTINEVFGQSLRTTEEADDFLQRIAVPHEAPRNAAEYLESRIGRELTNLLFRSYTRKMWALELEQLPATVVQRISICSDDEDRYFPGDRHQGLPLDGYAALIARILEHPAIRVTLATPFEKRMARDYTACFNSMAIDAYFDHALGPLPYRSLRFHHRTEPDTYALGRTVQVNFTDDSIYTRQSDWSLLPGHVLQATGAKTVTLEEPCADFDNNMERYYPVKTADGAPQALYERYRAMAAREAGMNFIGRCGTYRYLDMDQVVSQSLQGARAWLAQHADASVRRTAP